MDVVTTSLEALIQRATNPQNKKPDIAATEAFCVMLAKECQGINIASKLLAKQIQSNKEWEALQALLLLDTCMRRCGPAFHAEVGKFRFLNEMIKLVSPKYLGKKTPSPVQNKILELLHNWTTEYPKEIKIKEAYEMLKKQGVLKDNPLSSPKTTTDSIKTSSKNSIFEDEEKSRILQKLLQSKNPDDLHAANRLIRAMVKEDENRMMQVSNKVTQFHNNVKLLSDMLDSYNIGESSSDDFELITELYESCERLKPTVIVLANELDCNEEMLSEVLAANDALGQIVEKYARIFILGRSKNQQKKSNTANGPSLLDFLNPIEVTSPNTNFASNENKVTNSLETNQTSTNNTKSDMEVLQDIFTSLENSHSSSSVPDSPLLMSNVDIMQPSIISTTKEPEAVSTPVPIDSKAKALEELNELGELLLKESLSSVSINGFSDKSKNEASLPMNNAIKAMGSNSTADNSLQFNISKGWIMSDKCNNQKPYTDFKKQIEQPKINNQLSCNLNNTLSASMKKVDEPEATKHCTLSSAWSKEKFVDGTEKKQTGSFKQLEENNELQCDANKISFNGKIKAEENDEPLISIGNVIEIKPLADIHVTLENIKPGIIPPLTVIEEKNGITVVLHFAADSPRPDVSVIVVTTMSKNSKSLNNYLFQAVVPERCKCRLQPPSGTELPAHNPFLPPSAITQIILIANPYKEPLSLKFMLSYTMDNETITEIGEVDRLPII